MTMYTPRDCQVCGIPPLLFVRNTLDGRVVLYCFDCGGVFSAPEGADLAYGDVPIDIGMFAPAEMQEIERAGHGPYAKPVSGFFKFP